MNVRYLIDAHPADALSRALHLISHQWIDCNYVRWLDPNIVLAQSWNDYRLQRARNRLAAGEAAPPISVVGFRFGRSPELYEPSDGIHRTVAAREAGMKIGRAHV